MYQNRYVLRNIAGKYWLVDTKQPGMPYKAPMKMNDMGAQIWEMFEKNMEKEEMVQTLCKEYQADEELIAKDVEAFLCSLKQYIAGKVQES